MPSRSFTPDGIGARVAAVRAGAREFVGNVAAGADEREADLLAELRANADGYRLLEQARHRHPARWSSTAPPPVAEPTETYIAPE